MQLPKLTAQRDPPGREACMHRWSEGPLHTDADREGLFLSSLLAWNVCWGSWLLLMQSQANITEPVSCFSHPRRGPFRQH